MYESIVILGEDKHSMNDIMNILAIYNDIFCVSCNKSCNIMQTQKTGVAKSSISNTQCYTLSAHEMHLSYVLHNKY